MYLVPFKSTLDRQPVPPLVCYLPPTQTPNFMLQHRYPLPNQPPPNVHIDQLFDVRNGPRLEGCPPESLVISSNYCGHPENNHIGQGILLSCIGLRFGTPI